MELADRVKLKRQELEMSQDELARRMGYKSRSSINKIEMGRPVSQKIIVKLAESLNVTPAYLMGWEDDESEKKEEKRKKYPFIRTKREKHEFPIIKRIFVLFFLFLILQNIEKHGKNWIKVYAKLTQLTQKLRTF